MYIWICLLQMWPRTSMIHEHHTTGSGSSVYDQGRFNPHLITKGNEAGLFSVHHSYLSVYLSCGCACVCTCVWKVRGQSQLSALFSETRHPTGTCSLLLRQRQVASEAQGSSCFLSSAGMTSMCHYPSFWMWAQGTEGTEHTPPCLGDKHFTNWAVSPAGICGTLTF